VRSGNARCAALRGLRRQLLRRMRLRALPQLTRALRCAPQLAERGLDAAGAKPELVARVKAARSGAPLPAQADCAFLAVQNALRVTRPAHSHPARSRRRRSTQAHQGGCLQL
jgi:hypothetical protein